MKQFVKEFRYKTARDLINALMPWPENVAVEKYIFRGHSSYEYKLVPTFLREANSESIWRLVRIYMDMQGHSMDNAFAHMHAEYQLLRDFYRMADAAGLEVPVSPTLRKLLHQKIDLFTMSGIPNGARWLPEDILETAALAQHYGIFTRLLDWTYNPFVAAFFASKSILNSDGELCIWGLRTSEIGAVEHIEGGFPLKLVTPHYSGNPNLAAQQGLFTHWSVQVSDNDEIKKHLAVGKLLPVDRTPLNILLYKFMKSLAGETPSGVFLKFILPKSETEELARLLREMGYGPARIFPGYGGVAQELEERRYFERKKK